MLTGSGTWHDARVGRVPTADVLRLGQRCGLTGQGLGAGRAERADMPRSCSVSTPFGSTWSPVISLMKSSVKNVFHGSGSCAHAAPAPPSAATQPAGCDRLRHASPPVVLKRASTQQGVHVCMHVSVHAGHDTDLDATACRDMLRHAATSHTNDGSSGCRRARADLYSRSRGMANSFARPTGTGM